MASVIFKYRAIGRTCRTWFEYQEVCIDERMHISRMMTKKLRDGKPRIVRANEFDPRPCDGTCRKQKGRRLSPGEIKKLARVLERVLAKTIRLK